LFCYVISIISDRRRQKLENNLSENSINSLLHTFSEKILFLVAVTSCDDTQISPLSNETPFLETNHVDYNSVIITTQLQCAVLFQAVHWLLRADVSGAAKPKPWYLHIGLCCADEILREPNLGGVIGQASRASWMASAAGALSAVVKVLLEGELLPSLTASGNSYCLAICTFSMKQVKVAYSYCHDLFTTNCIEESTY
jgi:hypothetical protein